MWPGFKLHDPTRRGRGYRSPRCEGCWHLPERCICELLTPHASAIEVIVVMHAGEATRPTNTARLAVRCLQDARIVVRGRPDLPADLGPLDPASTALLFPRDDARELNEADLGGPLRTLVVPDGTWAQTRRIVRRQAPLPELPAVTLPRGPASEYALRTAPDRDKLCTLEAIAQALRWLDPHAPYAALMEVLRAANDAGLYRRGLHARP